MILSGKMLVCKKRTGKNKKRTGKNKKRTGKNKKRTGKNKKRTGKNRGGSIFCLFRGIWWEYEASRPLKMNSFRRENHGSCGFFEIRDFLDFGV